MTLIRTHLDRVRINPRLARDVRFLREDPDAQQRVARAVDLSLGPPDGLHGRLATVLLQLHLEQQSFSLHPEVTPISPTVSLNPESPPVSLSTFWEAAGINIAAPT